MQSIEALGPAERIIEAITKYTDHCQHNRPGTIVPDARQLVGVRWEQAIWCKEGEEKVVYRVTKTGKKQTKARIGVLEADGMVKDAGVEVARWREPGLFPEVVVHLYRQVAEVWKLDNEFAARWASWAFEHEENRDLKILLAAFLLVQNRFGEKVPDSTLADEDYRTVGEAMCLLRRKTGTFNPKMLLRIGEVLELPGVIAVNRELGFGQTGRRAVTGRYRGTVEKWLRYYESNPAVLEMLVKAGFRRSIMQLCRVVGYKPETDAFFAKLRWKQIQAKDGRRGMAIGSTLTAAESWKELDEAEICKRIVSSGLGWKRIVGMLPFGVTPAIMAAAIEGETLSDADLVILTPTLEELGLLSVPEITARWKSATERAENQRAAHIARNVKSEAVKEQLQVAVEKAVQKAVEEVTRDLRVYVIVDKSGSMRGAIELAKEYLAKMVVAFPLDRLHVCVFNTVGVEVQIRVPTAAGVSQAFRGHTAGGGTSYAAGAWCLLRDHKPREGEDALLIFVGDQEDNGVEQLVQVVKGSGVAPVAFGMLHVASAPGMQHGGWYGSPDVVERAAQALAIPCFKIAEEIFSDAYAVPRTLRNLIASTPVTHPTMRKTAPKRKSLIEQILSTPLLQRPVWA